MMTRHPSRSSRLIVVVAVAGATSIAADATAAQAAGWLPLATAGQRVLMQEGFMQGSTASVRHGPLSNEDQALVERWSQLFALVLGEFRNDHRSASANIEADFSAREIRIRRTVGGDAWAGRTPTKQELATADLPKLAKLLYDESKH